MEGPVVMPQMSVLLCHAKMEQLVLIYIVTTIAHVLLVLWAKIVKPTSMTAFHHRCVTMESVKMASTTSLVTVMKDIQDGIVRST